MGHNNHNHTSENKHTSATKGFQATNFKFGSNDVWADAPTKSVWHPNWQPNWTQPSLSFSPSSDQKTTTNFSQNAWTNEPVAAQPLWMTGASQANPWATNGVFTEGMVRTAWFSPPTCIAEGTKYFFVTCELPGVSDKDLNVIWNEGTLVIRGQKREFQFDGDCEIYATDQVRGHFHREVPMSHVAACIDANKISTKFADGVLEITLPKITDGNKSFIKVSAKK